jgi:hypothetical protein
MKTYKLKFNDKEQAISILKQKEVIDEELNYTPSTVAVVYIGTPIKVEGEYDEETGEVITEPIFEDFYLVDIMVRDEIDFEENEVHPKKQTHKFA